MMHLFFRDFEVRFPRLGSCSLYYVSFPRLFITTRLRPAPGRSPQPPGCTGLDLSVLGRRRPSPDQKAVYGDASLCTAREETGNDLGRVVLNWKNELDTLLNRIGKHYHWRKRRKGLGKVAMVATWKLKPT